jgi:hypothetical protein
MPHQPHPPWLNRPNNMRWRIKAVNFIIMQFASWSVFLNSTSKYPHQNSVLKNPHPPSCTMGSRGSFPGGKEAGAWSWSLSPSSDEVREWVELYIESPNTPSWCGAQLKHSDNFTFTLPVILPQAPFIGKWLVVFMPQQLFTQGKGP